ncbi:MAG: DUF465 domain-containing protein [Nitrospirae bacterium]|nr:DUF465 domain-containing protein [Nitrospirota bacterium]
MIEEEFNEKVIKKLRAESSEFKKLEEEHRKLDERIEEIDKIKFLSTEVELERKTLQKAKLVKKDQIAEMIRTHS